MIWTFFFVRLLMFCWVGVAASFMAQNSPIELKAGWSLWDPYQYEVFTEGQEPHLTGLDIKLDEKISQLAGVHISYEKMLWKDQLQAVKEGKKDIANAAMYSEKQAADYHYSIPVRYERDSLFLLRTNPLSIQFKTIDEMLEQFKKKKFRLGVTPGVHFNNPHLTEWIQNPNNQAQLVNAEDDAAHLENLLQGKIDGYIADEVSGATDIWRIHKGDQITEIFLGTKMPLHYIFSKKTVSLETVEKFNKAIREFNGPPDYREIVRQYFHPIILLQTIDTNWFRLIEYLGIFAFSVSGLVIAYRNSSTLFGAFIFALLPSIGGSIIRDVVFQRKPVGALKSPVYLGIIIITVLVGHFILWLYDFYRYRSRKEQVVAAETTIKRQRIFANILTICDGLGLAALTVSGVVVCVVVKIEPLWLWGGFFAFLSGASGGILRDLLSQDGKISALNSNTIYPEIAVIWGLLLSVFIMHQSMNLDPDPLHYSVVITVIGAFVTRICFYSYHPTQFYKT